MALKVIHAGLGGWGSDWERNAIPPVKEIEVVGWVDADRATLATARKKLDLPADRCFASVTEAIAAVDADAVLITVPMLWHVEVGLEAIAAGKHVLVEKPFASTVAEARRAVDAAEQAGVVLMVSQNYRQYPAPRKAQELLAKGDLGAVGTLRVDFRKYSNAGDQETGRHYRFQHALLYDMAIHHFDLLRMILDEEPDRVFTLVTDGPYSKFDDEGSASVLVTFPSGITASYRGSWISTGEPTTWGGEWHIECERGEIAFVTREGGEIGAQDDALSIRTLDGQVEEVRLDGKMVHGRSANLVAFARAIASGEEPETSGRRNLGSIAFMVATAESAATGQPVTVERV